MKKRLLALLLCVSMAGALTACGGSKSDTSAGSTQAESEPEEEPYEEQTFELGHWTVTITGDEVVYDESMTADALLIDLTVTNNYTEELAFSNTANIYAYQGDVGLNGANLRDENGDLIIGKWASGEMIQPGESTDYTIGFTLKDPEADALVSIWKYTVGCEGGMQDIPFVIKDRVSDEWKAALEAAAAELEEKKNATSYDCDYFTVEFTEDWYMESDGMSDCELARNDGSSGQLTFSASTTAKTPEEMAADMAGNYQRDPSECDVVEVGGYTWNRFPVREDQFVLFTTGADGHIIKVFGMFISQEDATAQIEKLTIK